MIDSKFIKGAGATLLSSTFYALSTILIKLAYRFNLKPLEVLALQAWTASVILLLYALLFHREAFHVNAKAFFVLFVQGIFGSLASSVLIFYSLHYLSVPVAMVMLYTYPAIVLGAGVLFWSKKVTPKEYLALGLTLSGTTIASGVLFANVTLSLIGLLIGGASAVTYSVLNLGGEAAMRHVSPVTVMIYSQWFSGLGLLVYFRGNVTLLPWNIPQLWIIGIVLAVFASIIPYYLLMVGIKRIGSDKAAIISTFELPMTYIFSTVFLREWPTFYQWMGGSLVFAGILLLNWRSSDEKRATSPIY